MIAVGQVDCQDSHGTVFGDNARGRGLDFVAPGARVRTLTAYDPSVVPEPVGQLDMTGTS